MDEATQMLIFDDGRGRWGPMTDRRPVFDLRTGAHTNRRRIQRALGRPPGALHVPTHLEAVCRARAAGRGLAVQINGDLAGGDWLLVNGRWTAVAHAQLVAQLASNHALVEADGDVVAVCLPAADAMPFLRRGDWQLPAGVEATELADRVLLGRPWHILDELPATLGADLQATPVPRFNAGAHPGAHPGVHVLGDHPVHVGSEARVLPGTVLNAEGGPIVIDGHALVHPGCMLEGPCFVGWHATLAAHTAIRPHTVIGPYCKIGGEVSAAIVHANTNKAHLGYLGNSLVGEWCNLGADTNVSNLKNTYGNVRVQLDPDSPAEDTGRMTHGPIVGDFVRTAIGTRLLTGSVIHTGCMLAQAGYAPKCAPPFGFYTDQGQQPHDLIRFLETVDRMLARRELTLGDAETELLTRLHTHATRRIV